MHGKPSGINYRFSSSWRRPGYLCRLCQYVLNRTMMSYWIYVYRSFPIPVISGLCGIAWFSICLNPVTVSNMIVCWLQDCLIHPTYPVSNDVDILQIFTGSPLKISSLRLKQAFQQSFNVSMKTIQAGAKVVGRDTTRAPFYHIPFSGIGYRGDPGGISIN